MVPTPVLREHVTSDVFRVREARRGERYGWISALTWVAIGVDSILGPIQDNRREIYWWVPFAFMMLTLISIHRVQRSENRRFELYSYRAVMLASALVLLGNLGLVFNVRALSALGFPGGAIVWMVGQIAFGIATWRARVFPWYLGLALVLWEPGSIIAGLLLAPIAPLHERDSYSAGLEKGFAMAVMAYGLRAYRTQSVPDSR
jgi:hypothetical protein